MGGVRSISSTEHHNVDIHYVMLKIHFLHGGHRDVTVRMNSSKQLNSQRFIIRENNDETYIGTIDQLYRFQSLHDFAFITNGDFVSKTFIINDCLKQNQTELNITMLCKYQNIRYIRYKCIYCGYFGPINHSEKQKWSHSPQLLFCAKCKHKIPSPFHQFSFPNIENVASSLQQSLQTAKDISSILYELNIPTNIIHCIIDHCVGHIAANIKNGEFEICNKSYHYCLIYNPFKRCDYEWLPIQIISHNNNTMDIMSDELGHIRTNENHLYDGSKWLDQHNCEYDENQICGLLHSFKECKVYIGLETMNCVEKISTDINITPDIETMVAFEIKTLTGKAMPVSIDVNKTILDLKMLVRDKEGIPAEQQRFISHTGKSMGPDQKILKSYGLFPGCMVYLVLRLRRGC